MSSLVTPQNSYTVPASNYNDNQPCSGLDVVSDRTTIGDNYNNHEHYDWDGWAPITETLTRVSATSVSVPGDLTTKYRKGALVAFVDGASVQYYGIIASSSYSSVTTISFIPNNDYSITAGVAITNAKISYSIDPQGFPVKFDYTPTLSGSGSMTLSGISISEAYFYKVAIERVSCRIAATFTVGGTPAAEIRATYPLTVTTMIGGRGTIQTNSLLKVLSANSSTTYAIAYADPTNAATAWTAGSSSININVEVQL